MLDSSFCSVVGGASLLYLAASGYTPRFFLLSCVFFNFPSFPIPVLALYFVLATWVQLSHPASPRPSSVSRANLVLTRPGYERWTGRRGVGRLNPRRENKYNARTGIGKEGKLEKTQERRKILARKWRRRGRAERRRLRQTKGGIEHVREDGRSQLPRTTSGRWRWMGRTELDWRWMFSVCTIDWGTTSSVCRRPAAADIQPSARLATWFTAAVGAVARMAGRKGKVE